MEKSGLTNSANSKGIIGPTGPTGSSACFRTNSANSKGITVPIGETGTFKCTCSGTGTSSENLPITINDSESINTRSKRKAKSVEEKYTSKRKKAKSVEEAWEKELGLSDGTSIQFKGKKREHDDSLNLKGSLKKVKRENIPLVFTFPKENKRKLDLEEDGLEIVEDTDKLKNKLKFLSDNPLPGGAKRKMMHGEIKPLNVRNMYVRDPIDEFLSQENLRDSEVIWLQFCPGAVGVVDFKEKYNCRNTFGGWWRVEIPLVDIPKLKEDHRISRVEGLNKMWMN